MLHQPPSDWQKIAELVENWKRFPQEPDQQIARIIALFSSLSDPTSVSTAAWLLSRDLRSRPIDPESLITLVQERNQIPLWLIEYSLTVNPDKAEVLAELDRPAVQQTILPIDLLTVVKELKKSDQKMKQVAAVWDQCQPRGRWLFNKIILGGYSTPISPVLVYKAIAAFLGCSVHAISASLPNWHPLTQSLHSLMGESNQVQTFSDIPVLPPIAESAVSKFIHETNHLTGLIFPRHLTRGLLHVKGPDAHLMNDEGVSIASLTTKLDEGLNDFWIDVFYEIGTGKNARVESIWLHDLPLLFAQNRPWTDRWAELIRWQELLGNEQLFKLPDLIEFHADSPTWKTHGHQMAIFKNKLPKEEYAHWLKPEKSTAKAMLVYVKRSTTDPNVWDEITLGMRHPSHPELVPVARWCPPASWPFLEEWQQAVKPLQGERFGPVITIRPGWLVEIAFDEIQVSRKHKSGFFIPEIEIKSWIMAENNLATDDVLDLYDQSATK